MLGRAAAGFAALAGAATVGAVLLPSSCGIEGAYFNRSVDAPSAVGNVIVSDSGLCWVPDVLIGAAAAFAFCALTLVVLAWRLRRPEAS